MLQTILKEEEEEFREWAMKTNFEKYYKISRIQEFINRYNAKIIKAICEEMKIEYRNDNVVISNIEKAKQLIETKL